MKKISRLIPVMLFLFVVFSCEKPNNNNPNNNDYDYNAAQIKDYFPAWADIEAQNTERYSYDNNLSEKENGKALSEKMQSLKSGDKLIIEKGTYSIDKYFDLVLQGTAKAPIWIEAENGTILTRPDIKQNVLNIGSASATAYLCIRGIEIKGGGTGIKMYNCNNLWIDKCHIHHTGGVGLAANTKDTEFIYITRNELNNLGHTGEGMYLGANNAEAIMSKSVVALNHVHDTNDGVSQGDGIELKQGSWGNLIAENLVHDCNYPCIIAYGTNGKPQNIIEKNICYNSNDNTMQIQGEAIVRNNLVIGGRGATFASKHHQGVTTNLQVIHNTFVNTAKATNMNMWGDKKNMVFANNVVYSKDSRSINFTSDANGVIISGNVVFGSVYGVTNGFVTTTQTNPLADFTELTWDASKINALPADGSIIIGAADAKYAVDEDIEGKTRDGSLDSGCYKK